MTTEAFGGLFGRHEILSSAEKIDRSNVVDVLNKAVAVHVGNAAQIDYLYRYMRGEQPVLGRSKKVRPEICNKIVENHASEIVQFTSGYFLGEPVTYVRRGDRDGSSDEVARLNDYMFFEDKASHDKDIATWMAICGVAYRMVMPDRSVVIEEDESPFELDVPDPRDTFVVYYSGFGHRRLMGVRRIYREDTHGNARAIYCVYTSDMYFEIENGYILKAESHSLGDIPIFEYRLNMSMMGSFEAAVPLLDAINDIQSNRCDGVAQFVQSFLKFKNCELDENDNIVQRLRDMGAIVIKSTGTGLDSDVQIMSQELNQQQTQTLVDYLYEQVLTICGLPSTIKNGGTSTSDSGQAVFLRNGWSITESRARDSELLFKRSEKQFLRFVLRIIREQMEFDLSLAEVECKFTRRQHDNLLTKSQSLLHMLEAGLAPEVAIGACGLFNDPMDVASQSEEYLKKWEYRDPIKMMSMDGDEDDEDGTAAEDEADSREDNASRSEPNESV